MGLARETSSAPKAKNCVHPSIDNRGGSTIHNIITSVCTYVHIVHVRTVLYYRTRIMKGSETMVT